MVFRIAVKNKKILNTATLLNLYYIGLSINNVFWEWKYEKK